MVLEKWSKEKSQRKLKGSKYVTLNQKESPSNWEDGKTV